MPKIDRKFSALLVPIGLWAAAGACGPSWVDLGARGGGVEAPIAGAGGVAASGSGGASGGGAAGLGQAGNIGAGAGAAAVSGSGSQPSAAGAGGAAPPDAAVADAGTDASRGCGMQPPAPMSDTSITVMGATLGYVVELATGYDRTRPYPLVMALRGPDMTMSAFRRDLDLPAVVGADGIVVYVEPDVANGVLMWDFTRHPPVIRELFAQLESRYCIDQRRVFVVGHSTGAIFANTLACTYTGVLRGLGSLNGNKSMGTACTGGLAVWISQGSADVTLPLGQLTRDFWVQQNHCSAGMGTPVDPSICIEYMGCEPGNPVRYCEYNGDGRLNVPSFAAVGLWNFFKGL